MLTEAHLQYMGIPQAHWRATLAQIPVHCAHADFFAEYVDNIVANVKKPRGLYLFGFCSMGKSACAAIALKAAAAHEVYGFWINAKTVASHVIQETEWRDGRTTYDFCLQSPLLVIDEVQLRGDSRFTETIIEDLVRSRVDDMLCTIITSNHTPEVLKERYASLGSVLMEAVLPLKVDGHNFREGMV